MSNCHSNAGIVMDMVIFPKRERRKQKRKLTKKKENIGLNPKKPVQKSRETDQKGKEEKWGQAAIPPEKRRMKMTQL